MREIALAILFGLVWAPGLAVGQTRQLHTKVTPLRAFMGDTVRLEIEVEHDPDDRVSVPRGMKLRPFEVIRRRTRTADGSGDKVKETVQIDLMAFELGELVVPSIDLRLVHPSGQVETLRTDPARVTVTGRLEGVDNAEPKGNHGPVQVTQDRMWPLWVGLALLVAILQFFVVRAVMKRRMKLRPVVPPAPPPRPPWEIALTKLQGIERSDLVEKGLAKEHYDAVSDVIREYLGALGGFDGLEMTTEETLSRLHAKVPPGIAYGQLLSFFAECDLVKFARQPASTEQANALLQAAVAVVVQTRAALTVAATVVPPRSSAPPAEEARP